MADTAGRDRAEPGTAVRPFLMLLVLAGAQLIAILDVILDALTRGYSAALLVGGLFAIAGIVVAIALIRVDRSQLEDASAAPPAA